MAGPKKPKVRQTSAIKFEDFAEADRIFQELVGKLDFNEIPRDRDTEPARAKRAKRRPKAEPQTIDLHGLTLQQAIDRLDTVLRELVHHLPTQVTVKIVTGRGLHSGPGGSILVREIHRHVQAKFGVWIVSIDDSPADLVLGGLPLRGYFTVTFARP